MNECIDHYRKHGCAYDKATHRFTRKNGNWVCADHAFAHFETNPTAWLI